jgi:hypothetical protein
MKSSQMAYSQLRFPRARLQYLCVNLPLAGSIGTPNDTPTSTKLY